MCFISTLLFAEILLFLNFPFPKLFFPKSQFSPKPKIKQVQVQFKPVSYKFYVELVRNWLTIT